MGVDDIREFKLPDEMNVNNSVGGVACPLKCF